MKFKRLIVLSSFLLVLFLTIGIATANENITSESSTIEFEQNLTYNNDCNSEIIADEESQPNDDYNARIIVSDMTQYYDEYNKIKVKVVDTDNDSIEWADVYFENHVSPYYQNNGIYYFHHNLNVGTHNVKFTLDDGIFKAKTTFIKITIVKSMFTGNIICKSYWGTTKDYITMRATVKHPNSNYRVNGYVTFKVNGRAYKVKTINGIATKTIRITKAGFYTYTATFSNNNYKSSRTGKAILYVYGTTYKDRTFNIKGYKAVLPEIKYRILVKAKNTNKAVSYEVYTNKFIKQKYRSYLPNGKYVYKTVKARGILVISFGGTNGLQTAPPYKYSSLLFTRYQFPDSFCTPGISGQKINSLINKIK